MDGDRIGPEGIVSNDHGCASSDRAPVVGGEMGQGMVEYALIGSIISIAAFAVISVLGSLLPSLYQGAIQGL